MRFELGQNLSQRVLGETLGISGGVETEPRRGRVRCAAKLLDQLDRRVGRGVRPVGDSGRAQIQRRLEPYTVKGDTAARSAILQCIAESFVGGCGVRDDRIPPDNKRSDISMTRS